MLIKNGDLSMKRVIYGGLLCAACAATGTAWGQGSIWTSGYDDTGALYISGVADWTFLDKRRVSRDDIGEQIGSGVNLPANFALELNYNNGSFAYRALGEREKL